MALPSEDFVPQPSPDLAGKVVRCAQRTLAATGVKVEWREDWVFEQPDEQRRRRRSGGLVPLLGKGARRVVKAGWTRATHDSFHFGHLAAKGVLEPHTGRYMIDFGSFAQVHDGQQTFGGRSGRRLATLSPFPAFTRADMLWVLRILLGTTTAAVEGQDLLHRTQCERLGVSIDLERAAAAAPDDVRVPRADSFDQLRAWPATVWIDDHHIRRVQVRGVESRDLSLELWDYGISPDEFDWSRLPTFRSPSEAARYSGQEESWRQKVRRSRLRT